MTKQPITVNGEVKMVREDTAKAFRGVNWAFWSLGLILAIVIFAIISAGFFMFSTNDAPANEPKAESGQGAPN